MTIQITPQWTPEIPGDWSVVFISSTESLEIPEQTPPEIRQLIQTLQAANDLPTKQAELRKLYGVACPAFPRVLLACYGNHSFTELKQEEQFRLFSAVARSLCERADRQVVWFLPDACDAAALQTASTTLTMAPQTQGLYQQEPKKFAYQSVQLISAVDSAPALEQGAIVGRAINLTRELINRGPHEVSPDSFALRASVMAAQTGLTCRILDEHQLQTERMNSLLAVARGSDYEPRMVVLEYRGAGEAEFIGLVGKGVTYDSGGLSLKPTDSMKTMKCDMAGAATVLGVMQAVAELKLPVNVRGYMGLVENMISGCSYRLGDVLTARNGVTIEVMNTDAEGRLVLADVLCYAVDEGCRKLIDIATLTGACVVALGEDYTGVMTNDQDWCDHFLQAAKKAGEKAWQLPMCDSFNDQLRSDVADCRNVGGRWGGAITAAKFLEKFVSETPWVHLDIAGPAFLVDNKSYREGGASGVMVRSLLEVLQTEAAAF